ncbi:TPA: hypothetical protein ACK2W2_005554 [Klebsiella michiganensis]|nr:hypothetical protein [Citrobacter freundii]QLO06670.1 hypothetical protein HV141_24530 [Citrobacter freundii]
MYSESIDRAISILKDAGEKIGMELGSNVTSRESELLEDALMGLTKVKGQLCGAPSLTDVQADVVPFSLCSTNNDDTPH